MDVNVNENIVNENMGDMEEIIEDNTLNDIGSTVDYMLSSNWKERFIAEYVQLQTRLDKLVDFIWDYEEDSNKLECPISLIDLQIEKMSGYMRILHIRADIYGIDLSEEIKKLNKK